MPHLTEYFVVLAGFSFLMLLHGTLIAVYLAGASAKWRDRIDSPGKLILLGFILSLTINVCLIYLFDALSLRIGDVKFGLLCIDLFVAGILFRNSRAQRAQPTRFLLSGTRHDWCLLFCLVIMFGVMLRNGAAIGTLTDAWWHMAIVYKMSYSQEIAQGIHPLTASGTFERPVYPPFWHINLAVLHSLVKKPIPLIWATATAFVTVLTMLAFHSFSLAVSRDRNIACLSVILFSVLTGGLNTYHRVLAWPSNVSFLLLYATIAFVFFILARTDDRSRGQARKSGVVTTALTRYKSEYPYLLIIVLCIFLMAGIHTAALFWAVVSFFNYFLLLPLMKGPEQMHRTDLRNDARLSWVVLVSAVLSMAALMLYREKLHDDGNLAILFTPLLIYVFLLGCRSVLEKYSSRLPFNATSYIYAFLICSVIWLLLDIGHFYELFRPHVVATTSYYFHVPRETTGVWDLALKLPKWEHQLRGGLLPTGLLALALSIWLFFSRPGRGTAFLFANGIFAMLVLCSPYLFSWYGLFIPETSIYRIHLLMFSPLIFATAIVFLLRSLLGKRR